MNRVIGTPIALVVVIALLACGGASSNTTTTPGGNAGHSIKCKNDPSDCYEEAGALCPTGYTVVHSGKHMGGQIADYLPGPVVWYDFLVECNSADVRRVGQVETKERATCDTEEQRSECEASGGTCRHAGAGQMSCFADAVASKSPAVDEGDEEPKAARCENDLDCSGDQTCFVPSGQRRGICGAPAGAAPQAEEQPAGSGCQTSGDCAAGGRCVKPAGATEGVCTR